MEATIPRRSGQSTSSTAVSAINNFLAFGDTLSILKKYWMCGIVGYFDQSGSIEGPLGATISKMLEALACRGPDSAGVALFGRSVPGTFFTRVKVAGHAERIIREAERFGASDLTRKGAYLR